MADTQQEVLKVLLDSVFSHNLIPKSTYDKANSLVHSAIDLPDFFWYSVCCHKEGETNGCTKD